MSRNLPLDFELRTIRSFLKRITDSVDAEYSEIVRRSEAGKFTSDEDESNAFFYPMMCEEIAIRATLGELNALIEWELQHIFMQPRENVQRPINLTLSE